MCAFVLNCGGGYFPKFRKMGVIVEKIAKKGLLNGIFRVLFPKMQLERKPIMDGPNPMG